MEAISGDWALTEPDGEGDASTAPLGGASGRADVAESGVATSDIAESVAEVIADSLGGISITGLDGLEAVSDRNTSPAQVTTIPTLAKGPGDEAFAVLAAGDAVLEAGDEGRLR